MFNQYKSILLLLSHKCYNNVISEYRNLYESYVIFKFLDKHPDLFEAYKNFSYVVSKNIYGNFESEIQGFEDQLEILKQKYGSDFFKEYGWTKSVILQGKNRKLITLADEGGIPKPFYKLYKISCNYIHPNPYSTTHLMPLEFTFAFLSSANDILIDELQILFGLFNLPEKEILFAKNLLLILKRSIEKILLK